MKLAKYLHDEKISDEAFGLKIGLSQSQVNRIRRGKSTPSLETIARIAAATKRAVSFEDFVDEVAR